MGLPSNWYILAPKAPPLHFLENGGYLGLTLAVVENGFGRFRMDWGLRKDWRPYVFREAVWVRDGAIYWMMERPAGLLIQYDRGIRRFIAQHELYSIGIDPF